MFFRREQYSSNFFNNRFKLHFVIVVVEDKGFTDLTTFLTNAGQKYASLYWIAFLIFFVSGEIKRLFLFPFSQLIRDISFETKRFRRRGTIHVVSLSVDILRS